MIILGIYQFDSIFVYLEPRHDLCFDRKLDDIWGGLVVRRSRPGSRYVTFEHLGPFYIMLAEHKPQSDLMSAPTPGAGLGFCEERATTMTPSAMDVFSL